MLNQLQTLLKMPDAGEVEILAFISGLVTSTASQAELIARMERENATFKAIEAQKEADEAAIKEKMACGLNHGQAMAVIRRQHQYDATSAMSGTGETKPTTAEPVFYES